ncbi:MAG: zf-HC2 domain-containing protein [Candidatus Omnitrophica bacterium]|nr:zf-HC2 domain-containing protein [Candidatus Omnitrophota bacterium]
MNCANVRDLLMTDYTDGELKDKTAGKVREHIATCPKCKEFEEALKNNVISPLKSAGRKKPPDFIWERIKSRIITERETAPRKASLRILKPVFAVPVVAVAVFTLIVITHFYRAAGIGTVDSYMEEQASFIANLDGVGTETNGLGTSIEEFLL